MRSKELQAALVLAMVALTGRAAAQGFPVTRLPAPGGEVIFANPDEKDVMYDQLHYAAARRAGDFVFLAGVEVGPLEGEGTDSTAFAKQLRRGFGAIKASLAAAGAEMNQIVQMQSFHNCHSDNFDGDFNDQLVTMLGVMFEMWPPPYSAWTAICIDRHYSDNTVVEIQVTAYAPLKK